MISGSRLMFAQRADGATTGAYSADVVLFRRMTDFGVTGIQGGLPEGLNCTFDNADYAERSRFVSERLGYTLRAPNVESVFCLGCVERRRAPLR